MPFFCGHRSRNQRAPSHHDREALRHSGNQTNCRQRESHLHIWNTHNLVAIQQTVFSVDLHYCCSLPTIVGDRLPQGSLNPGWCQGWTPNCPIQFYLHHLAQHHCVSTSSGLHCLCRLWVCQAFGWRSRHHYPLIFQPHSQAWCRAPSSPLTDYLSMPVHDDFPQISWA